MRSIVESFRLHEAKRVNELLRILTVYMTYTNVPFPLAPFPTCTSARQGTNIASDFFTFVRRSQK